jgi:hypothetical protein
LLTVDAREKLEKAEGRDGAERRRRGRHLGGHGGYPFHTLLNRSAFLSDDSQIILHMAQHNGSPDMPAMQPLHGCSSRFRHVLVAVTAPCRFPPMPRRNHAAPRRASVAERTLADVPFSC